MRSLFVAIIIYVAVTVPGFARYSHVALIVGNSAYDHVPDLPNAVRDAALVARAFQKLGYHTRFVKDANRIELMQALVAFRIDAQFASQAVFYFSGHGVRLGGSSLMVLRGAQPDGRLLGRNAVPLNTVLKAISDKPRQKIVFWDACQTSPLQGQEQAHFAPDTVTAETIVAFAAQPGSVAFDGTGKAGPFARAISVEVMSPNRRVSQVMKQIKLRVVRETLGQQVPWTMDSLLTDVSFTGPDASG